MQNTFMKNTMNSNSTMNGGFNVTGNAFKKQSIVSKPVDPVVMEEFRQILNELSANDWNKRLKVIDDLTNFIKSNQNVIKNAQPSKFI